MIYKFTGLFFFCYLMNRISLTIYVADKRALAKRPYSASRLIPMIVGTH